MKRFEEIFRNDEMVELMKKNVEFTMNMLKDNAKENQNLMTDGLNRYFDMVNTNLEMLSDNYDKAVAQGTEIADLYRENIEKTEKIAKDLTEKIRNMHKEA